MKLKMMFAAAALIVSPALATAACLGHSEQVMTCADGLVYDAQSNSCIVQTS